MHVEMELGRGGMKEKEGRNGFENLTRQVQSKVSQILNKSKGGLGKSFPC